MDVAIHSKRKRSLKEEKFTPIAPLKPKAPPAKIAAKRLILKKLKLSMGEVIFETVDHNRLHLGRFLSWVDFLTDIRHERSWIVTQTRKWKERSQFVYGIFLVKDNTYIGNIDAHAIDWVNHKVEIGYWLAERFEGHGYMTEAVQAMERALFDVGFHRIVIQCNSKNKLSARIPLRCGYLLEGVLRQNAIEKGQFRDTMVFSKIATD